MHLADAFIQSDLQSIQGIHMYCQYMRSLRIEPTTFALLMQCSTTEPQEHYADDTQLYMSSRPGETHQIEKLMECIVDIKKLYDE